MPPYMPPYMPLCFSIVERRCNHIDKKKKGISVAEDFSFFISSSRSPSSFSLTFSFTFSSFLGSVFKSNLVLLGYVIVEV